MKTSNYIRIFTGDFFIVQRIIGQLKTININAVVKDPTESARLAGFGGGILPGFQEIFVNLNELDKAIHIVESITSELRA